jgi:hypothetical protein
MCCFKTGLHKKLLLLLVDGVLPSPQSLGSMHSAQFIFEMTLRHSANLWLWGVSLTVHH